MEDLILIPTLLTVNSCLFHTILVNFDNYSKLTRDKKFECVGRISGSLFQLYLVYTGFYASSDKAVIQFIRQIAGYMIYEICHMLTHSTMISMYIHHCVCLLACMLVYIVKEEERYMFYKSTWLLESTAPLLSVCWLLHTFNYPDTRLHTFIKVFTFLYWSCIRMLYFPYYIWISGHTSVCVVGFPVIILNTFWFRLLLKRVMK